MKAPSDAFTRYTDAEWVEIQQAVQFRKDCPPGLNWTEIRIDLEQVGRDFWMMRGRRLRRPSPREHERLRQLIKPMQDLETAFPRLGQELKVKLEPAYRWMLAWDALLEVWSSKHFRGRADAHRSLLYQRVLLMWIGPLRGEPKFSRTVDGEVSGPLARFLAHVLGPILGPEAPGPEGIASIVKQEQKRLAAYAKFWDGFPSRRWERSDPPADAI
jgi:hypothetical protein